jgi:hypothetical protein
MRALNRHVERVFTRPQGPSLGAAEAEEGPMNVKGAPLLCPTRDDARTTLRRANQTGIEGCRFDTSEVNL